MKVKEDPKAKLNAKLESGFAVTNKNGEDKNKEELKEKSRLAREKFEAL